MKKNNNILKGIGLILVVIIVFYLLNIFIDFSNINNLNSLKEAIISMGVFAPLVFMLIMAIAIIISPIPSLPLDITGGIIWGPYLGTFYAMIGATTGAIISFLIARFLGRESVEKFFSKEIAFCNKCTERKLGWIIFITRLFPFFQFDIISYGAGLTNIKLRTFIVATFLGMIPMTFLFAYFGKSFFAGNVLSIILSVILIILIFVIPIIIKKYDIFGLRKKIEHNL